MPIAFSISIGAVLGALSRYYMIAYITKILGQTMPYGTAIVNILGSFIMGVLLQIFATNYTGSPELKAFLIVGFLGAFTTFSAFSADVVMLTGRGETMNAFIYILISVVASISAIFAGIYLVKTLS